MEQCVSADASSATMTPSVGAGGSLIRSDSCDAVVVKLPAMPAPPTGMAYQLWMIKGDAPRSMGLVPSLDGAMVPMPIRAGDSAVAVTVEPAAGSDQPTGQPIWAVPLH
jgi:anti-sigma-K factor RskA